MKASLSLFPFVPRIVHAVVSLSSHFLPFLLPVSLLVFLPLSFPLRLVGTQRWYAISVCLSVQAKEIIHVSVASIFFVHLLSLCTASKEAGGYVRAFLFVSGHSTFPLFTLPGVFLVGRSREPHFRLPRDLFPNSFSCLIGFSVAIYGASRGDRVISFGFENVRDLDVAAERGKFLRASGCE